MKKIIGFMTSGKVELILGGAFIVMSAQSAADSEYVWSAVSLVIGALDIWNGWRKTK